MKPALQSLLKPVGHPEFTVPAAMALGSPATCVGMAMVFERDEPFPLWLFAGLSLLCAVSLVFRNILGTILMIGLLGALIIIGIQHFQFSWTRLLNAIPGIIMIVAVIIYAIEQIKYHRRGRLARL